MRSISELRAAARPGHDPRIEWREPDDGLLAYVGEELMGSVFSTSEGIGWKAVGGAEGELLDSASGTYAERTDACCAAVEAAILAWLKTR